VLNDIENGNTNSGKIMLYSETWFPKISELINGMTDTEKRAIEEIVSKDPSDTWDEVAQRIGISVRQLFNIRQNEKVQEAVYTISREIFKGDVPDVLKTLTRKAKAGEPWAVRLFLEVALEMSKPEKSPDDEYCFPIEDSRAMLKVGGDK
jgi:hypothetical protein